MRKNIIKKTPIFLLIAILVVVGLFGYGLIGHPVMAQSDLSVTGNSSGTLIDPQSEAVLNDIESIQLDTNFFTDSTFASLQDFTIPLSPEPVGKSNPFALLPGEQATNSSQSSSSH